MRLYTVQPLEVLDILQSKGCFSCDSSLSEGGKCKEFRRAYNWIGTEMDKRKISHPERIELPLWAWHTRDWKRNADISYNNYELGNTGEKYACIEFEIPDDQVLLSDYNAWHNVLNNTWYEDSTNEEEFEAMQTWFDSQDDETRRKLTVESWQKVFDVSPLKSNWLHRGRYIQATFWELRSDMIHNVKTFVCGSKENKI